MKVLGLIPARGGSKGIKRKNIRILHEKPLIYYTITNALMSSKLTQVVVSSDDAEIARISKRWGAEVPFLRPKELAEDETPTLPVVQHAVLYFEERGVHFDAVCLLQPTSPLRQTKDIDNCIDALENSGADSVVSVLKVPAEYNPHWVYFQNGEGFLNLSIGEESPIPRRQELPSAFHREGSIYITRRDVLIEQNSLYGKKIYPYLVNSETSVNIDEPKDWLRAEELLSK